MRVLLVVSEYHRRGGFPRYGAQLAVGLAELGHEVTVLTRRAERDARDEGIEFRPYRVWGPRTLLPMALEPFVVTRAVRRLRQEHDVVLVVGLPVLAPVVLFGTGAHRGYFVETLTTLRPTQLRWWVERLRPFHRVVMAWERLMLRRPHPSLIVVGAERFRREYLELYGLSPDRVAVVPLGVETAEFVFDARLRERTRAELGVAPGTRMLLEVAGRGRQKGLDVLVDALEELPGDADWCAVFAGSGSTARELVRRTASLRSQGKVRLVGKVADVRSFYCAADLLVFPSRYDPWGLVVTEALACGLPVVASSHAGASTAVRFPENGAVIDDPGDHHEVARRIMEVWGRPFDRREVAASVSAYDITEVATLLEPHLLRLAGGPSREASGS